MTPKASLRSARKILLLTVLSLLGISSNVFAGELSRHTPKFAQTAPDHGPLNSSQVITVKVHLKGNSAAASSFVQQLGDSASPNFQKFITPEQYKKAFGASAADRAQVRKFLAANNIEVVASDGLSITAQGTVANLEKAFHTQIHRFLVKGKMVHGNISDPVVEGAAGEAIAAVSGLAQALAEPHSVRPLASDRKPVQGIPLSKLGPNGLFFSPQCFRGFVTVKLDGVVADISAGNPRVGQSASAVYRGPRFGADIGNTELGTLPPCGYQPSEVNHAYKIDDLHKLGLDGTGESIVIVDAFGSPTLAEDVALFSRLYGLPKANITTFRVNATGVPRRQDEGWAVETTLDVEWAHAVAPKAKIFLIVAADNTFVNLGAAVKFAVEHRLGRVISNSYGAAEVVLDQGTIADTEAVLREAAAAGIAVNYSTGDDGDFRFIVSPPVPTVSYPSSSKLATAVGGTSLALDKNNTIRFQTGWGNNMTLLSLATAAANNPVVPPSHDPDFGLGFVFGAGGGSSDLFSKPRFQRRLPGKTRQLPDIAYLADPFTGVEIIFSPTKGNPVVEVIGGTSLSVPMFSALWAITSQAAGHKNLGQAAPILYELHDHAIDDIRVPNAGNVFGVIHIPGKTFFETPQELSQPLFNQQRFVSALFQDLSADWSNLTFGTDTSLVVREGWDNVTGLGTPNAPEFVRRVVKQTREGRDNDHKD